MLIIMSIAIILNYGLTFKWTDDIKIVKDFKF